MATAPKATTTTTTKDETPAAPEGAAEAKPAAAPPPPAAQDAAAPAAAPEEQVSAEDWGALREESLPRKQTVALPGFVKKEMGEGRGADTAANYDARFKAYLGAPTA